MKFLALLALGLAPLVSAASSESGLGPAPTESYGCEPHGDHYHCEGAVTETAAVSSAVSTPVSATATTTTAASASGDASSTASLPPSPTESSDCEPHGDHWHCHGAASTSGASDDDEAEATPTPTGGAMANMIPLAGAIVAAAVAF